MQLNVATPFEVIRAMLPILGAAANAETPARIVNVGSVFGAIGFPFFTAYSATKFGLRGFSEALRRELFERGIGVTYVAPRATQTPMNSAAIHRYADAAGMVFDDPILVAARIVQAIESDAAERTLGGPEPLFARLNGLWPQLFDRLLRKNQRLARRAVAEEQTV
jgi:short-subunit dehydrogenase